MEHSGLTGESAFSLFNALAPRIQRPRIFGAAALDICLVASGAADGYFEPGNYIWDIAAADLILRRADGAGSVLREFGDHKLAYLGSNGTIHEPLRDILDPSSEVPCTAHPDRGVDAFTPVALGSRERAERPGMRLLQRLAIHGTGPHALLHSPSPRFGGNRTHPAAR